MDCLDFFTCVKAFNKALKYLSISVGRVDGLNKLPSANQIAEFFQVQFLSAG